MSTIHSTVHELEQQLTRTYALVASARDALIRDGAESESVAMRLLDMAEDELSDVRFVQRLKLNPGMAST